MLAVGIFSSCSFAAAAAAAALSYFYVCVFVCTLSFLMRPRRRLVSNFFHKAHKHKAGEKANEKEKEKERKILVMESMQSARETINFNKVHFIQSHFHSLTLFKFTVCVCVCQFAFFSSIGSFLFCSLSLSLSPPLHALFCVCIK